MRATVLSTGVLLMALCGCGGSSRTPPPLEANEYQEQMEQLSKEVQKQEGRKTKPPRS